MWSPWVPAPLSETHVCVVPVVGRGSGGLPWQLVQLEAKSAVCRWQPVQRCVSAPLWLASAVLVVWL